MRAAAAWVAAFWAALAGLSEAQETDESEAAGAAAALTVSIRAVREDGSVSEGFAFVFGVRDEMAYLATANHVLRGDFPGEGAARVEVEQQRLPGLATSAAPLDRHSPALDLGVVAMPAERLAEARLDIADPEAGALDRGTPVRFVGRDGEWYVPARPGVVNRVDRVAHEILIDDLAVTVGSSGGPLVTARGLAGMIVRATPGGGAVAVRLPAIREQIRLWGLPWSLRARRARPGMVAFPAGVFRRGADLADVAAARSMLAAAGIETPRDRFDASTPSLIARLDAFAIDAREVSWRDYMAFAVSPEGGGPPPAWVLDRRLGPDHPVAGVTWAEARDYCRAQGMRLPTETEWERAARGAEMRLLPWGDALGPLDGVAICRACPAGAPDRAGPLPVGASETDVSPEGVRDLAGNVREWTADWYSSRFHRHAAAGETVNLTPGEHRSVRGGGWADGPALAFGFARSGVEPDRRDLGVGFRCAIDLAGDAG